MKKLTFMLQMSLILFAQTACEKKQFEDKSKQSASTQTAEQEAEEETFATEPAAIAGAFLNCIYKDPAASDEVNCRLEKDNEPQFLVPAPTTMWRVKQETQEVAVEVKDMDTGTGWQWSFLLPRKGIVLVDMVLSYEGRELAFSDTFAANGEATPVTEAPPVPRDPALANSYLYGQQSDFILKSSLTGGLLLPPQDCTQKLHTIPESVNFLISDQMNFDFTIKENDTKTSLSLENICGQTQSGHYVEVRGPGFYRIVTLPPDATRLVVLDKVNMAAGDYRILVKSLAFVLLKSEFFMFDKLSLQSDKELVLKTAGGT